MAKKEFNIQELINLQKTVETLISKSTYTIIAHNANLKGTDSNFDIVKEYETLDKYFDQLIVIKLAKDKANRSKTKLGATNQQLILELSNLNRKRVMLETLFEQKGKARKGGKVDVYEFQISKKTIEENLDQIKQRISDIKRAMTDFNTSKKVKIVINDALDL
jgi:hypothetical protein